MCVKMVGDDLQFEKKFELLHCEDLNCDFPFIQQGVQVGNINVRLVLVCLPCLALLSVLFCWQ